MLTRKPNVPLLKRAALAVTVAAFGLTMAQPSMAAATTATKPSTNLVAKAQADEITDFSAQRRGGYARRGGGGYGGTAAAAAVAGIVGTAIIASQANRGYGYGYGDPYESYAYSPGYDAGGPGYYGGGPSYYGSAPSYYGGGYGRDPSTFGGPTYRGNGNRW